MFLYNDIVIHDYMANVLPFSHLTPSSAKSFPNTTAPSWCRKLWLSVCIFCPTWRKMWLHGSLWLLMICG